MLDAGKARQGSNNSSSIVAAAMMIVKVEEDLVIVSGVNINQAANLLTSSLLLLRNGLHGRRPIMRML